MALTTINDVLQATRPAINFIKNTTSGREGAGFLCNTSYYGGFPIAMLAPTSSISGDALISFVGQIPFPADIPGDNIYIAGITATSSATGQALLCDRLWHNANISSTTITSQTINSVTWPARDRNGTTDGEDIFIALETSVATTNVSDISTITLSYTNSSGISGRTATITNFPATTVEFTFVPFELQSGDIGVRSIQSLTLGTSLVSGTVHLVAYRVLARMSFPVVTEFRSIDAITGGFVRVYDNTCPFWLWNPTSTAGSLLSGSITYAQG